MLNGWNRFLNQLHATTQISSNQVQNLGIKVLSETEIFDGRNSFPTLINREFRIHLSEVQPYRNRFDNFLNAVSITSEEVIQILSDCDREVEEDLDVEIRLDLILANNCAAL